MSKYKLKLFSIIYNLILILFLGVLILTFLSVLGVPKGLRLFVVESGSMEPAISTGSLAIVSPSTTYNAGDIITFNSRMESGGQKRFVVTHRVVEKTVEDGDTYYVTKGDANEKADPLRANGLDVVGKVSFTVPYLGYIVGFAKTRLGFILVVIMPSVILVYNELLNIYRELKKMRHERKDQRHSSLLNVNVGV